MVFFAVFCSIMGLLHFYVGRRLLHDTQLTQPWKHRAWLALFALGCSIPTAFMLGMRGERSLAQWPSRLAYVWLGYLFYLVLFLAARDVVRVLGVAFAWLGRRLQRQRAATPAPPTTPPSAQPEMNRRVFMARTLAAGTGLAALGTTGLGVRASLGELTTPEVAVRLTRLPKALDGFRIAQISDVHIGTMLGKRFLRAVVETTNRLKPDLIVITGDLVDGSPPSTSASSPRSMR